MIKLRVTQQKLIKQFGENYTVKFPGFTGDLTNITYEVKELNDVAIEGIENGDYEIVE